MLKQMHNNQTKHQSKIKLCPNDVTK